MRRSVYRVPGPNSFSFSLYSSLFFYSLNKARELIYDAPMVVSHLFKFLRSSTRQIPRVYGLLVSDSECAYLLTIYVRSNLIPRATIFLAVDCGSGNEIASEAVNVSWGTSGHSFEITAGFKTRSFKCQ